MRSSTFRLLVASLVVIDLVAVALHLLHVRAGVGSPEWLLSGRFALNADRGLAELLGYVQVLAAVALLVALFRHVRQPLPLAWAAVLFVVVVDDAFFLHERLGARAAAAWDLPATAGLRGSDLGELAVWALLGACGLVTLLLAARSSSAGERRASRPLVAAFAGLIAFAVVLDMVHQAVGGGGATLMGVALNPALRFVEASGELFTMSAILLAVVARLLRLGGPAHDVARRPGLAQVP